MDKFDHLHCGECDAELSIEEIAKLGPKCPTCGKETIWMSEIMSFNFDEE